MDPAAWPFFGKSVWCVYPPAYPGSKAQLPMTKSARLSVVTLALLVAALGAGGESAPARSAGPQQGGGPRGPAAVQKFDHSDPIARYNSMLSQAIHSAAQMTEKVDASACRALVGDGQSDRDGDGLADAYDGAPEDAGEFVLANDRQLPDLRVFDDSDTVFMVLTLMPMLDGSLLISTGNGLVILDKDSGETLRFYDLGTPGWAASGPTVDGEGIVVGNFFTGQVVIISRETGEVVRSNFIGQTNSLSGVAQFPG